MCPAPAFPNPHTTSLELGWVGNTLGIRFSYAARQLGATRASSIFTHCSLTVWGMPASHDCWPELLWIHNSPGPNLTVTLLLFCSISTQNPLKALKLLKHSIRPANAEGQSPGCPKRGLNKVSFFCFFFLKRGREKDSSSGSSPPPSFWRRLTAGPACRCWFIPCVFIFLQTFLLHQVASRPKLLSPPWKILRHHWALTSFLGFPVGNEGRGWGRAKHKFGVQVYQGCFHLSILNLKICARNHPNPSLWHTFIDNWMGFFLPNIDINEDLRRKYNTENSIPGIKVSLQMGVLCRLGFVIKLQIKIWDIEPLWSWVNYWKFSEIPFLIWKTWGWNITFPEAANVQMRGLLQSFLWSTWHSINTTFSYRLRYRNSYV